MNDIGSNIPHSQDDEQQIFDAVEAYQTELDAGRYPDKTAFIERLPTQSKRLAELLHICDMVSTPRMLSTTVTSEMSTGDSTIARIGDYQLIREIGRGGMGIIYEAYQLSLERKVALKLMRFAPLENDRSRKRFSNEAHAAATLQHPNIVPVYACGFEAATPYYVMQNIDGISVARLIQRLREATPVTLNTEKHHAEEIASSKVSSTLLDRVLVQVPPVHSIKYFQWVIRLIIQATHAIQYAHDCGMIHRDIKPGNLLIDATGTLWVTDFGLAHLPGSDVTITGEALGTPRYMSPEQVQFPKTPVDHRTDIYSLGATLYELLTLQPAFSHENRTLLAQAIIQNEPVSPGKQVRTIPHDLQVITCKAIAKSPSDRYATVQQLSEDLQRYLEDRPILARPPTLQRRLWQWGRRNPYLVGMALISLLLVLVSGIVILWRENAWNEATVASQSDAIKTQKKLQSRVSGNLKLALNILEEYFLSEEENRMLTEIPLPRQQEILQEGIRLYEQLALNNDDPFASYKLIQAHRRLGTMYAEVGQVDKAEAALRQAVALARQQEAAQSNGPAKAELVECLSNLANALRKNNQAAQSKEHYQQALNLSIQLNRLYPSNTSYVLTHGNILLNLSLAFNLNERLAMNKEALAVMEEHSAKVPTHPMFQGNLAFTLQSLASCQLELKQFKDAARNSRQAVKVINGIPEEERSWRLQIIYARCYTTLAQSLSHISQDANEVQPCIEKALATLYSIQHYANVEAILSAIALNQVTLARWLFDQKDYDHALPYYLEAEKNYLKLKARLPDSEIWSRAAASVQSSLSSYYRRKGQAPEVIDSLERAIANDPKQLVYQSRLAWHLAVVQDPALRNGKRAVELALPAVQKSENNPDLLLRLAAAYIACNEWENAFKTLEHGMKQRKKPIPTELVLMARALYGRGDHALAKTTMIKALEAKEEAEQAQTDALEPDKMLLYQEIHQIVFGSPLPSSKKK